MRVSNRLIKRIERNMAAIGTQYVGLWSLPLMGARSAHVLAEIDVVISTIINNVKLQIFHRKWYQFNSQKRSNLLNLSRQSEAIPETLLLFKKYSYNEIHT